MVVEEGRAHALPPFHSYSSLALPTCLRASLEVLVHHSETHKMTMNPLTAAQEAVLDGAPVPASQLHLEIYLALATHFVYLPNFAYVGSCDPCHLRQARDAQFWGGGGLSTHKSVVERQKPRDKAGDRALLVPRKRSSVALLQKPADDPAVNKGVKKGVQAGLAVAEADLKQVPLGSDSNGGSLGAPEPRTTLHKALVIKRREKRFKKDGNEIDDIFG